MAERSRALGLLHKGLDRALAVQRPVVVAAVERARRRRPGASPAEVVRVLEKQYLGSMAGAGLAVGGSAAAPGVGTTAALALSAGESVTFLEASALFTLAVAEVHGVEIADVERRRTLLLAVLAGETGASLVEKAAGRTGGHWGRLLVEAVPMTRITQVNRVLGRWFVTKYGTRQGIIVLGRVVPLGVGAAIGAGGNALVARSVITGARRAFGPPPDQWAETTPPTAGRPHPGRDDLTDPALTSGASGAGGTE